MSDFTVAEYNFASEQYTLRRRIFNRQEAITSFVDLCTGHGITVDREAVEESVAQPGRVSMQKVAGNYGLSITTLNNQVEGIGRPIRRKEPSC